MKNRKSKIFLKIVLFYLFIVNISLAQIILPADPYNYIYEEYKAYKSNNSKNLYFRPIIIDKDTHWLINLSNQFFYNNGNPNLENTGNRWIGNGFSYFSRLHISYIGEFVKFGGFLAMQKRNPPPH